ncbi:hypothetical protein [Actinoplanes xinjiangensis]|uniref:WD40 repeat protein n=1 Tax=Actinoplanes xinjiangensis TaxID=512350 RepID=A0A316FS50_9ACTN|nr:hypothetical protein [Actinoplanes xinjiangensis]PWK51598.1 hypothetical protein BC793_102634 [Actinoplanes xinjiangensis]GIF35958.1 hypothetical protein Axi01nite_02690 [Actinoplanes xinjiangensis]
MARISEDVAEAVRTAANAARGYPGDLADVHRRARRRRNRQAVLSAAAVVAVLAGAGVGVASQRQQAAPALPPAATDPPAAAVPSVGPSAPSNPAPPAREPAQHLILRDAAGTYRTEGQAVELGIGSRVGELRPDWTLVTHRVVGSRNWERLVVLPDGSRVAFGSHDTEPGTRRTDGPDVSGLEYRLVVTGRDGAVRLQRDVRRHDEPVMLLTATATTAYLWRPAGLVSHDLETGTERTVVRKASAGLGEVFGSLRFADLSGGRLVVSRMTDECVPRVYDVATGRLVAELPLTGAGCVAVTDMRLSPDGATLGVVYEHSGATGPQTRAVLIRVADRRELIGSEDLLVDRAKTSPAISVAWEDDHTLRGAIYPVGAAGVSGVDAFSLTRD